MVEAHSSAKRERSPQPRLGEVDQPSSCGQLCPQASFDPFSDEIEKELSDIEQEAAASFRHYTSSASGATPTNPTLPKKAGRKPRICTLILRQFTPAKKMEKDGLRTRLLRAFKRCLRDIRKLCRQNRGAGADHLAGCWPPCFRKKTQDLRPSDLTDSKVQANWRSLIEIYLEDPTYLDFQSRQGPRNDGRKKKCEQGSYNNDYCQKLFSSELVRRSYEAYMELVFGHKTSEELCERFQAKCCSNLKHSTNCAGLWAQLETLVISDEFLL